MRNSLILARITIILFSMFMCFGIGYGISTVRSTLKQKAFDQTHEVFCKDCCWRWTPVTRDGVEVDHIYTCSKDKERLWRKVN